MTKFDLSRLKAERVARNLDQEEMAKRLGMSRSSYSKRENGKIDISVDELAKIIQVLGMSKNNLSLFFTQNVPNKQQIKWGKYGKPITIFW